MSARKFRPKACDVCGREYVPTANVQRYCSPECRKAARPKKYVPRFSDEELSEMAKVAVNALDEVQRLRLKALLAGKRAWQRMMREVLP